jgi:hypothetical protein
MSTSREYMRVPSVSLFAFTETGSRSFVQRDTREDDLINKNIKIAAKNMRKLKVELSKKESLAIARFIENQEYTKSNSNYIPKNRIEGIHHSILIDQKCNKVFINGFGKLGKGGFKTVKNLSCMTKTIQK